MQSILSNVRHYSKKIAETTMKYLNVAEKNDAAKSIAAVLSNGRAQRFEGISPYNKIYKFQAMVRGANVEMLMTSVSGHLLTHDFVASYKGWQACDPLSLFEAPIYKMCPEKYVKIQETLRREIRSCGGLIIWTDCDREGENIGFEIIEVCRAVKPNIPVYRAKFSEITAAGIRRALDTLGPPDERQSQAVDVRSELDLRIGAAFTRFQTLRYQKIFPAHIEGLVSYGSCQIPTLGFVVRRFDDVEKFIPQDFWKLKLTHQIDDLTVEFNWARNRLFDKNCCEALLMVCQADPTVQVISVTKKPKNKWRPRAMDTIELEKLGSRKLKISAKETMTIAEKLYTQGIISYPRTETNMFSNEIDLKSLVQNHTAHPDWGAFAHRVLEWQPRPHNGNKSDQAHPPIHPTKMVQNLTGNEARVYELIVRHFLACVSRDAVGSETTVNVVVANEEFTGIGLCIHERNYLDVYIYERWNAKEIHNYEPGHTFEPTELTMISGKTSPPSLLTEADLIALMDKHGIGTDATHAEHINTVKDRGYIGELRGGYLVPGQLGMGLVEGYDAINLPLAYPELRAELERDLKLICLGQRDPKEVLDEQIKKYREVYKAIAAKITDMDNKLANRFEVAPADVPAAPAQVQQTIEEVFKCPRCNRFNMAVRSKKDNNGYYISCVGKPACNHVLWINDVIKEISVLDDECQRCRAGTKRVKIKFKRMNVLSLLNTANVTDDNYYVSCIRCDATLKTVLDIDNSNLRPANAANNSTTQSQQPANSTVNSTTGGGSRNAATASTQGNPQRRDQWNVSAALLAPPAARPPLVPTNNINNRPNIGGNSNNFNNRPPPSSGSNTMNRSFGNDQDVKCPRCQQPAKKLTVRKDGPNQGRPFYVCPKQPQCDGNFFQWADVPAGSSNTSFAPSSSGSNVSTYGSGAGTSSRPSYPASASAPSDFGAAPGRAKRKCGICKEEGHTRLKCPRRPDANH